VSVLLFLASVVVVLGACGGRPDHPSGQADSRPQLGPRIPPSIDWDAPLRGGMTVSSLAEAQQYVPFRSRVPRFAGARLLRIQVDNPSEVAPTDRLLALVYDLPSHGRVVVEEKLSHLTEEFFARRANAPDSPPGAFRLIRARGLQALLITDGRVGRVMWIEDGVLFDVTGLSVGPDEVVSLASEL
jgi:hypothetical protein